MPYPTLTPSEKQTWGLFQHYFKPRYCTPVTLVLFSWQHELTRCQMNTLTPFLSQADEIRNRDRASFCSSAELDVGRFTASAGSGDGHLARAFAHSQSRGLGLGLSADHWYIPTLASSRVGGPAIRKCPLSCTCCPCSAALTVQGARSAPRGRAELQDAGVNTARMLITKTAEKTNNAIQMGRSGHISFTLGNRAVDHS